MLRGLLSKVLSVKLKKQAKKFMNDIIEDDAEDLLSGQILIAMPQLQDTRFHHAVILVCGHDAQGAMGIVLNKAMPNFNFLQLLGQLDIKPSAQTPEIPIYYGGPVEVGRGFLLHSKEFQNATTAEVSENVFITATLDALIAMSKGECPKDYLLALGYAGWSAGQLEEEIQENSWIQIDGDYDLIFNTPRDLLWKKSLMKLGIDPEHLVVESGHA